MYLIPFYARKDPVPAQPATSVTQSGQELVGRSSVLGMLERFLVVVEAKSSIIQP
jgi:hypothetical protein